MYWVVFAAFSLVEFFADIVAGWIPFYWLLKVTFRLHITYMCVDRRLMKREFGDWRNCALYVRIWKTYVCQTQHLVPGEIACQVLHLTKVGPMLLTFR